MFAFVQLQFRWSLLVSILDIRKGHGFSGIPRFIPHTKSTPPDETDNTGRRTLTFSDQSDVTGQIGPNASTS